jgi:hypothetical protein
MTFVGLLEDMGKATATAKAKTEVNGWERFYIPTHRDETAMNGAPDLLWLVEGEQRQRQKQILRVTNKRTGTAATTAQQIYTG